MSKYDDCHRVDNRYTTAIGMSWQGFSLTSYERSNYMKGLERQLEKDPEDQELILKVSKCKTIA